MYLPSYQRQGQSIIQISCVDTLWEDEGALIESGTSPLWSKGEGSCHDQCSVTKKDQIDRVRCALLPDQKFLKLR